MTLETRITRLEDGSDIQARVDEIVARATTQSGASVDSIVEELEQMRLTAIAHKQLNVAVSAIVAKAKVKGLMVEKAEVNVMHSLADRVGRAKKRVAQYERSNGG